MNIDEKETIDPKDESVGISPITNLKQITSEAVSGTLLKAQEKGLVIIVCGPAHSGKSVFFHTIKKALPDNMTYGFRACPDGEGDWTQMGEESTVNAIRNKGAFSKETTDWFNASIENSKKYIPITFVDVGGKMSPEKDAIFAHGTHCIVLCRSDKPGEKKEWEQFAKAHNLMLIASLDTSLIGVDVLNTSTEVMRGNIAGLERRKSINSPVIDALVRNIQELVSINPLLEDSQKAGNRRILNIVALGEKMGVQTKTKIIKDRQTGEKKEVSHKSWGKKEFGRLIHSGIPCDDSFPLQLDGIAPVFVYAYLTSHLSGEIYITDPKLPVGKILFRDSGGDREEKVDILKYHTEQRINNTILYVDIPGNIFNMELFSYIPHPPIVPDDTGIILTGTSIPIPIFCKIVDFYRDKVPYIAIRTPQQSEDSGMIDPCMIVYGERMGEYISFA